MSSEQKGFVIGITFLLLFAGLVSTIPSDLQGAETNPDLMTPLHPSLITDFSDSATYSKSNFTVFTCVYDLGGRTWVCHLVGDAFSLGAKVLIGGILWLGQLDSCNFISSNGDNRGYSLTTTEIETDAPDGSTRYSLQYITTGASAGGFVVYWNTTTYPDDPYDAWDNDELYLLHGVGITDTSSMDITALIIGLLLLQLPDVPPLINLLLATPIYASFIFIAWFIIKESLPFV